MAVRRGILFFPISYVIDDVLTEVYGFARARRAIWAGFAALLFMALMEWTVVHLPVAQGWTGQPAYERGVRLGLADHPRLDGRLLRRRFPELGRARQDEDLDRQGKYLWTRTIGSTVIGEGADSLIFYPLAFYGMRRLAGAALVAVMLSQFILKVGWEVLLTPVTYAVVGWLKRREGVDVYDVGTDFTPLPPTSERPFTGRSIDGAETSRRQGECHARVRLTLPLRCRVRSARAGHDRRHLRRADDARAATPVFDTPGPDRVLMCMAPPSTSGCTECRQARR